MPGHIPVREATRRMASRAMCRGIRIEHRANAVKQFGKEILHVEPGQGRVGDRKQIAQLLRPGPRHRSASLGPSRRPRHRTAVSMRVIYINTWWVCSHDPAR